MRIHTNNQVKQDARRHVARARGRGDAVTAAPVMPARARLVRALGGDAATVIAGLPVGGRGALAGPAVFPWIQKSYWTPLRARLAARILSPSARHSRLAGIPFAEVLS